ncbi:putative 6-phosphogluconolactonase [Paramyrothecium foliicola]|nr:putative 6-phosphogluconolactonase [Paramyrothecium foliicola]
MLRQLSTILAGFSLVPSVFSASLLASHFSGKVYTLNFSQNGNSGNLAITSETTGCGTTPSWLQLYSEDQKVYCFDESWTGRGYIAQYNVATDGRLTLSTQFSTSGNDVHGVLYGGADGKSFLATAQYSPSTITTYRVPTSSNNAVLQREKFTMTNKGPNPRQDVPHPHEIIVDPTGQFLLVPDLGADIIRIFRINASSGQLTSCGTGQAAPGDGPRHGKWWQPQGATNGTDSLRLFTLNELGNSVSAWNVSYNSGCMSLSKTQTLSTYTTGTKPGASTKAAELHIFDNFLYASNRADQTFGSNQDSLAIYNIDSTSGAISWLEATNSHTYYPRTFQINKAGTLVAVAGQTSSNVAIISRDLVTGRLGAVLANVQVGPAGRPGQEDGLSAVVWNE